MKGHTLSREKIADLENLHRALRNKRQAHCVYAVIALSRGLVVGSGFGDSSF